MVISAAAPREHSQAGAFAQAFAGALGGRADSSADGVITSGELYRHLLRLVPSTTNDSQHPMVDARHDPSFAVAVLPGASGGAGSSAERIDKAKFVFQGGISPTVQCPGAEVTACDPSCYLWNVSAGWCTASAIFDGRRQSTRFELQQRGRWVCADPGSGLDCTADQ